MTREQIIKKYQIDKRQHVAQERIGSAYDDTIHKTFAELSKLVNEFAKEHGVDPNSVQINTTGEGEGHCGAEVYIDLYCQRALTDDELNKMVDNFISIEIQDNENRKRMQKERNDRERKEYDRLKKKFEKTNK